MNLNLTQKLAAAGVLTLVLVVAISFKKPLLPDGELDSKNKSDKAWVAQPPSNIPSVSKKIQTGQSNSAITPAQALAAHVKARSISNLERRSLACSEIIGKLCLAGFSAEAWGMIDENPGQVRSFELAAFFRNAKVPLKEFIDKVEGLPFGEEVESALAARTADFKLDDMRAMLSDSNFQLLLSSKSKLNAEFAQELPGRYLHGALAFEKDPAQTAKILEGASEWHAKGLIDDDDFGRAVSRDISKTSFEKWDLIKNLGKTKDAPPIIGGLREGCINAMVNADAGKSVELFMQTRDDQSYLDMSAAISRWGLLDPVAANKWFSENKDALHTEQKDAAARAFYKTALNVGETDGAEQWANQISDTKLRDELLRQLPKKNITEASKP